MASVVVSAARVVATSSGVALFVPALQAVSIDTKKAKTNSIDISPKFFFIKSHPRVI